MKQFLVKVARPAVSDPFGMSEPTEFLYFYCAGLSDLRKTIRCWTPQGYRVRSKEWFSKQLRRGSLTLMNPFFRTMMYDIKQIAFSPEIEIEKKYCNGSGFSHFLKKVNSDQWLIN